MNIAAPSAAESSFGYHRIATFLACPRKYAYRYLLRLEPARQSKGAATGSLVHIGLMHLYLRRAGADALDPVEAMRAAPARVVWTLDDALAIYAQYVEWCGGNDGFRVLDVEREFVAYVHGKRVTARLDLVVEESGAVWIHDAKTTGEDVRNHHLAWECSGQMALADAIGAGVLPEVYRLPYGGVRITSISNRASEVFACRKPIRVPVEFQRGALLGVARGVAMIEGFAARGVDPWYYPMHAEACRDRWGLCDYMPLCRYGEEARGRYEQTVDTASMVAEGSGTR